MLRLDFLFYLHDLVCFEGTEKVYKNAQLKQNLSIRNLIVMEKRLHFFDKGD
jgi:hypothetical protein